VGAQGDCLTMAAIPQPSNTTGAAIHAHHAARVAAEKARDYLGWSALGDECERALWYGFRWVGAKQIDGRLARLFDTGHREEARLLDELRALGYEVWDRDERGQQFGVSSVNGHLRGHADAVVLGLPEAPKTPHLVDVKTIKAKKFDELLKKGMRALYPKYIAQGLGYCGHMKLDRAAFIFVCKDDDRIHIERFEFDKAEFDKLEAKARRIVFAASPPLRLSDDPAWFACKFCDFHAVCHGDAVPAVNCRTCAYATPVEAGDAGEWRCELGSKKVSQPRDAHDCHLFIPPLLSKLGEPIDGGENHVIYQAKTGAQFTNGPAPGFSSIEIRKAGPAVLDATMLAAKAAFPTARVVSGTGFDDMPDSDLDADVKPARPGDAEKAVARAQTTRQMAALAGIADSDVPF
jgi:hypothetical protein